MKQFHDFDVILTVLGCIQFVELRNSFAHGDKSVPVSSLQDVKDYFDFLEKVVNVINSVLQKELHNIEERHYRQCFKSFDMCL